MLPRIKTKLWHTIFYMNEKFFKYKSTFLRSPHVYIFRVLVWFDLAMSVSPSVESWIELKRNKNENLQKYFFYVRFDWYWNVPKTLKNPPFFTNISLIRNERNSKERICYIAFNGRKIIKNQTCAYTAHLPNKPK